MKYKQLAYQLKTQQVNELRTALTHKSFYRKEDEAKGSSRYVFAGMFAFKGLTAEVLFRYVPATGTQLQHALGNLFKNEHLNRLFDTFELQKYIRHGADFPAERHRHIFVFGLLGYLHIHATAEVKEAFIRRHFILPNEQTLMPQTKKRDMQAQCNVFALMLYGCQTRLSMAKQNETWTTTITAGERTVAAETSASYRYSRRKALKKALLSLAAEHNRQQPDYEQRLQHLEQLQAEKTAAQKAERQAAFAQKQAKKAAERKQKKEDWQQKAIETDIKRRKAKAAAKQRKEEQARRNTENAARMANMSTNKRRHLQDKGQL
ncbi:hypothetical protein FACS189434_01700 [Bacteroidia bacterium]|nr:hypothetical protein FACS189434_01700 [Bacteroidia bacterium]